MPNLKKSLGAFEDHILFFVFFIYLFIFLVYFFFNLILDKVQLQMATQHFVLAF